MTYTSHIPSPPLNAYIDDLYYLDGPAPHSRLKTFPVPALHLMVNFGQAFSVSLLDQEQPFATCTQSWWVGMFSSSHIVDWPSSVQFFGVHFKPGGAAPFLPLPLSELHNQVVTLDALWGPFATEMRERLHDVSTIQAGFALFEQLLLARLCWTPPGLALVHHALEEITSHCGTLSIRQLSDQLGISQNHLNTQFKRFVGISPKEFARLSRFFSALRSLDPMGPVDWTLIAHRAGFYDQSHFNKDFVTFTGDNPGAYLRLRQRICAQHPQQSSPLGQLAIE